jgi:hypothetical protein
MFWLIVVGVAGFIAGLLVGRRNPSVAALAAAGANALVADATTAADRLK